MSTYLYLECLDHGPPLGSAGESGQHLYDLADIRDDIKNRDTLIAAARLDAWPDESFRRNTVTFLMQHPKCRVRIVDEYDTEHPIEGES